MKKINISSFLYTFGVWDRKYIYIPFSQEERKIILNTLNKDKLDGKLIYMYDNTYIDLNEIDLSRSKDPNNNDNIYYNGDIDWDPEYYTIYVYINEDIPQSSLNEFIMISNSSIIVESGEICIQCIEYYRNNIPIDPEKYYFQLSNGRYNISLFKKIMETRRIYDDTLLSGRIVKTIEFFDQEFILNINLINKYNML